LRPLFVSPGLSRDAGERLGTILRCDGSPASRGPVVAAPGERARRRGLL